MALPTTTGPPAHHCLQELSKSFESTLEALVKKNNREIEKSESTFAQEMRQELRRKKQIQSKDLKSFQASQKAEEKRVTIKACLLYTSPSPRDS